MTKPVHFYYRGGRATAVSLVGDFNGWNPKVHPMARRVDGSWFVEALLPHGHHEYYFLVDGTPTADSEAMGVVRNAWGDAICLIAVSWEGRTVFV